MKSFFWFFSGSGFFGLPQSAALLLVFSHVSFAGSFVLESGEKRVNLVELYSSEGCSSCPPADRWLASLRSDSKLWSDYVPVEFHVDYWNRLGWIDPFSNKSFSRRQSQYAGEWNSRNVYTPGFVLNGREWRNKKVADFKNKGTKSVGNLMVEKIKGNKYRVRFQVANQSQRLRVFGALLGNGLETDVLTGENAGSKLRHEFVVLSLQKAQMSFKEGHFVAELTLPEVTKAKPKSLSVAFWVTDAKSLAPLQAVGGDLPPTGGR